MIRVDLFSSRHPEKLVTPRNSASPPRNDMHNHHHRSRNGSALASCQAIVIIVRFACQVGFKGVLITSGDYRQIGPVVPHANSQQQIQASPRESAAWHHFKQFTLKTAQRTAKDPGWDTHLTHLGDGTSGVVGFTSPDNRPIVDLSFVVHRFDKTDVDAAIDFLDGGDDDDDDNSTATKNRAILAPTNKLVQYWNDLIQDRNPMPLRTYVGVTELDGDQDAHDAELADDKLDTYEAQSAPSHSLSLKEGDWVFLTRTIDKKEKLVANTRIRIVQLRDHTIEISLPSEDNASPPKHFNVCRWRSLFYMSKVPHLPITRQDLRQYCAHSFPSWRAGFGHRDRTYAVPVSSRLRSDLQ